MALKKNTRKKIFSIRLSDTEKQTWEKIALERNISIAQLIRESIKYFTRISEIRKEDSILSQQLFELRELIKDVKNTYNFDREIILSQIAHMQQESNPTLEEKIKLHLTGRSLFLNILSKYCQESPKTVLAVLANMKEAGVVDQDQQMRWYLTQ
ncbi:hypothetical protein [Candidatus Harpocratesius sp.]